MSHKISACVCVCMGGFKYGSQHCQYHTKYSHLYHNIFLGKKKKNIYMNYSEVGMCNYAYVLAHTAVMLW